ncbi:hypothetical protein EI94DRAFT_1703346 [Lactarius quietus]|nr:hypothetical protein EI94DRAFT_1703346 [Lactarius quietus]
MVASCGIATVDMLMGQLGALGQQDWTVKTTEKKKKNPWKPGTRDGNGNVLLTSDHINPESWEGNVNVWNVIVVTTRNLACQQVASEFPASDIEDTLLDLESKAYNMELPFGQIAENIKEPDNNGGHSGTPIVLDTLSAQDVTSLILLLKPGKGNNPVLDLYNHVHQNQLQWTWINRLLQLINKILFDPSPILEISPSFLMEPNITVQFQTYQVIETSLVDPNIDGANWKWDQRLEHAVLKTCVPHLSAKLRLMSAQSPGTLRALCVPITSMCLSYEKGRGLGVHHRSMSKYCIAQTCDLPSMPINISRVWKYDMKTHLACIHPSTNRSDSEKGYVTLGEADLRLVLGSQAQCCFESSSNF